MSDANPLPTELDEIQDLESATKAGEKFDLIEWRRQQIITYLGMGKTQREMAELLKVHESTISLDVKYLREEAKQRHGEYIDNLPMRHKVRVAAIDKAISELWRLYEKESDIKAKKGVLDSITDALIKQAQIDGDPAAIERALKVTARIRKQLEQQEEEQHPEVVNNA
jgi:hypothetical protein